MSTHVIASHFLGRHSTPPVDVSSVAVRWLAPVGRALFAAIFITASFGHFSRATIDYAASLGVPAASILVPFSGVMALVGGLSVLFGYRARLGAALLVLFLVPVTLSMHKFWGLADPTAAQLQQVMFMKNIALIGGALLLMFFGSGPVSVDSRKP